MYLETDKIIVREFISSDVVELKRFLSSGYVAKWMPGWFDGGDSVDEWFVEIINDYSDNNQENKFGCYAVVKKSSGIFMGCAECMMNDGDIIGITICMNPDYIDCGHLTDAYKVLIDYLLRTQSGKAIEIISQAENIIESKAVEKLGLLLTKANQIEEVKTFNHYLIT